jgi:hypothetical protein
MSEASRSPAGSAEREADMPDPGDFMTVAAAILTLNQQR